MDPSSLVGLLRGALSPDPLQRKAAEEVLEANQAASGYAITLLQVAGEESVELEVRQVAAITFKNRIRKGWDIHDTRAGSNEQALIGNEEKVAIRAILLDVLIRAPTVVKSQLTDALKLIVRTDYPEHWPGLLILLVDKLKLQNPAELHGGLSALRVLTRKYEFRGSEDLKPLTVIVNATFPALLHVFQALLASGGTSLETAELLKLIMKSFYSVIYLGAVPLLLRDEQFVGWMQGIHTVITSSVPPEGLPPDLEARQSNQWWKAKKWALHILTRLVGSYGDAKCEKSSKTDKEFGKMWRIKCSISFLESILTLLANYSNGMYLTPRVVNASLNFLQKSIGWSNTWVVLRPHCGNLMTGCLFPLCCFDDEDQALWEEDPQEYIRKGYDIMEELYNTKTAAINFIHEVCEKRPKGNLDNFMSHVAGVMTSFGVAVAAGTADEKMARQMDGALLIVGALDDVLKRKPPYKNELENFLSTHVMKCFESPFAFLRAKACWVTGQYSDIRFTEGFGRGPLFQALLQHALTLMRDPELPVRIEAVSALRNLIDAFDKGKLDLMLPILPQLLEELFSLLNELPENEDLVFTLETVVEKFEDHIAPHAMAVCQHLANAFWRMQGGLEGDEEGAGDDGAMAMYGCLRALSSVLDCVSGVESMFPQLEELLFPIMQRFCSSEGDEVLEEILELISYFTYFSPQISPKMWSLLPQIVACYEEFGVDQMEYMEVPVQNYISRGADVLVTSQEPNYLNMVNHLVHCCLGNEELQERDAILGLRLLDVVMQNCHGHVDTLVPEYIKLATDRLMREPTPTAAIKEQLVLVVANAFYYNAALALGTLQQQGRLKWFFTLWLEMIFTLKRRTHKPMYFCKMYQKKVNVMGLACVLTVAEPHWDPDLQAGLGQLLTAILKQSLALKQQELEEQEREGEEEADDEDEDGTFDVDGGEEQEAEDEEEDDETDDEKDDEYLKRLEKEAKKRAKKAGAISDEDSDDDNDDYEDYTDDEENEAMPVNDIDIFVTFAEMLRDAQTKMPLRFQALSQLLDAATRSSLEGLLQYADSRKREKFENAVEVPNGVLQTANGGGH